MQTTNLSTPRPGTILLVPEGRKTIAQGVSLGDRQPSTPQAPEGRQKPAGCLEPAVAAPVRATGPQMPSCGVRHRGICYPWKKGLARSLVAPPPTKNRPRDVPIPFLTCPSAGVFAVLQARSSQGPPIKDSDS